MSYGCASSHVNIFCPTYFVQACDVGEYIVIVQYCLVANNAITFTNVANVDVLLDCQHTTVTNVFQRVGLWAGVGRRGRGLLSEPGTMAQLHFAQIRLAIDKTCSLSNVCAIRWLG